MKLEENNILFIVRTMDLGGTENVVLQLCEILVKYVNKIVVCSSGGVHEKKLKEMGIKHYTIPDIASKKVRDMLTIKKSIKNIIKKEEISIVHSHHRMGAFYAQIVSPKHIVKIANAHNTFYDKKLLTKFSYRNTNLIAVGDMVKKNLVDFFQIPTNQVTVIYNAVKPMQGELDIIPIIEKEKRNGNTLIGNIGRLTEQKGMSYFIDAAEITLKKHHNVKFFIIGDGNLKKDLIKRVENKNLKDSIFFLGYRSDVQNVIAQLDFIVLSSLWEGLPLTPIEAFSVSKTVIGTSVDGTPEIIEDGINGFLVNPKNPFELSEKMNILIENEQTRKLLEIHAKQCYLDKFSFNKLTAEYIEYFSRL